MGISTPFEKELTLEDNPERHAEKSRSRRIVIVITLVVATAALCIGAYFLTRGQKTELIPSVYPGVLGEAGKLHIRNPSWDGKAYSTAASVSSIVDWYRNEMPARGWMKTEDRYDDFHRSHKLTFVKENTEIRVDISFYESLTVSGEIKWELNKIILLYGPIGTEPNWFWV